MSAKISIFDDTPSKMAGFGHFRLIFAFIMVRKWPFLKNVIFYSERIYSCDKLHGEQSYHIWICSRHFMAFITHMHKNAILAILTHFGPFLHIFSRMRIEFDLHRSYFEKKSKPPWKFGGSIKRYETIEKCLNQFYCRRKVELNDEEKLFF